MQAQQRLELLFVLTAVPELIEQILSLLPIYELVTWGFACRPFIGVESLRGLCSLRAVNTLAAAAVNSFVVPRLEQPVFSDPLGFADFALQCLHLTERLNMGFEDALSHHNALLYQPIAELPQRAWDLHTHMPYLNNNEAHALRSQMAVDLFKWYQFIPSDMRPRWIERYLRNTDHSAYINHHTQMYLRVPLNYFYLWPLKPYGCLVQEANAEFPMLLYEFEFFPYRGITLTQPRDRRCFAYGNQY